MPENGVTRELVAVQDLKIAPENTRTKRTLLDKLIQEWDDELCQPLEVAPDYDSAGGMTLLVVDGGTRFSAARQLAKTHMDCRVHWNTKTASQRALLFRQLNFGRVNVGRIDDFKALVLAGFGPAVSVQNAVTDRGWYFSHAGWRNAPNSVAAPAAMLQAHDWGVLELTLDLIKDIWPDLPQGRSEAMIKSISALFVMYGRQLNRPRILRQLQKRQPGHLVRDARQLQSLKGGSIWGSMVETLVNLYNRGLGDDNPGWLRALPLPPQTFRWPQAGTTRSVSLRRN